MVRYVLMSYLIGSIPFAYILTRLSSGLDIRRIASRNVGTTNVMMHIGIVPGVLTMIGDVMKGVFAALLGALSPYTNLPFFLPAFAVAGHNWPVWLKFRGGGGLATFIGSSLVLTGVERTAAAVIVWGIMYLIIKDHDWSALAACAIAPLLLFLLTRSTQYMIFYGTSSLMIALRRIQSTVEKAAHIKEVEGSSCPR